jgi:phosphoribosylformylglycinamidine synthase
VTPQKAEEVLERARLLELPARIVGRIGGDAISLKGDTALPLSELRTAHEGWLPKLMSSELGA